MSSLNYFDKYKSTRKTKIILIFWEISTIKIPVIIGIKIITPIIMVLFIKIKIPPKICNNPTNHSKFALHIEDL